MSTVATVAPERKRPYRHRPQRYALECPVISPLGHARTRNISSTGLLVEAVDGEWMPRPKVGELISLRLRLDHAGADPFDIDARARVVRSRRDARSRCVLVAAVFLDLSFGQH
ncbi:MAG TPA: PilZ domain-containing protein [Xanthomonadaceae bacterium]|nr:PilZ domain-containing protein [Xanthomonadaceae bacterium]